jgi:AraC-like DNA-binding protein
MIASLGLHGAPVLRGIEEDIRCLSGAISVRVIEAGGSVVEEHCHDWPVLSLYVMGDVLKVQEGGSVRVNRPAVILHGAREPHSNLIGSSGLEQLDIQFDPAWIKRSAADGRGRCVSFWSGGSVVGDANRHRLKWLDPRACAAELASATAQFLDRAFAAEERREPEWLPTVLRKLEREEVQSTEQLARELGMHPGWLAQAYRDAVGEGLRQTVQRHRVERATKLLRTTNLEAADVAAAAGFCDQSHMIRSFKRLLGRTPSRIRAERERLPCRWDFPR